MNHQLLEGMTTVISLSLVFASDEEYGIESLEGKGNWIESTGLSSDWREKISI